MYSLREYDLAFGKLFHVVVECLLSALQDVQGARQDVADIRCPVKQVFEEHPYVVADDAGLDDLYAEAGLVGCFEHELAVFFRDVVDARQGKLEEGIVFIVVDVDVAAHLELEIDVPVFGVDFRAESLLFEEFKNSF